MRTREGKEEERKTASSEAKEGQADRSEKAISKGSLMEFEILKVEQVF